MPSENVTTVRRGFALWNTAATEPDEQTWRAALAELVAAYDPAAEIDFSRTLPDFPAKGVVEAMTEWVESARDMFTDVHLAPTDIVDAGDAIAAAMRIRGKGALSGVSVDAEVFYVFRLRAGKVVAATTYMTYPEAMDAIERAE